MKIFFEFLRCIYPDKMKMITDRNVYTLLPLAHEYNVEEMIKRCRQLIMQIVKNKHTGNIRELYRHIHLSELYNLEEVKEKCIYLASENTLHRIKAARTAYQISDASHYKIIEIALRRRELDKFDDEIFNVCNTKEETIKKNFDKFFGITCELKGHISTEGYSERDIYRALRLMERFKITENHKSIKSELIQRLQYVYDNGKYIEEFHLLPENIKESVQNKKK
ncbi:uncharacterized protein LOC132742069 [Ruditapes philippinarum]|uniref:uncharacterized protein LOC132742069 n=1 Tax=Ruditapes philippinarum TaxID=129788 RepID=UPI00295B86E3|nr:uncharacterized protein LOC132742069 [Ruditapes philippinarum]